MTTDHSSVDSDRIASLPSVPARVLAALALWAVLLAVLFVPQVVAGFAVGVGLVVAGHRLRRSVSGRSRRSTGSRSVDSTRTAEGRRTPQSPALH